jgi:hypothetical protein
MKLKLTALALLAMTSAASAQSVTANNITTSGTTTMTIIKRVLNGETYKSVGDDFGISRERVRCICFGTFRRKLKFEV